MHILIAQAVVYLDYVVVYLAVYDIVEFRYDAAFGRRISFSTNVVLMALIGLSNLRVSYRSSLNDESQATTDPTRDGLMMDRPPNVLFIVADSLRHDAVFGDRCETHTLDELASEGTVFSACYSQGISTAPSMTAMLTGRYPLDYGGHWYIADDQPTMAEQFRANGYRTAAIHSNPNVSRIRNFDKGFDTFEENILPFSGGIVADRLPDAVVKLLNKGARVLSKTPYLPAKDINDQMLDWIDSTDRPWFLWTQYMDTHGPYLPGDSFSYSNKFRAERLWRKAAVEAPEDITDEEHEELYHNYRLEVEYLDAALNRFLEALEKRGVLDDTIVVFVSDHGDEFGEHGLYGHKNLPYEELVRVPLLIRFPDRHNVPAPDDIEVPVRCIDILPTILEVVSADLTPEMKQRLVGESLTDMFSGGEPSYDVLVTEKEMRDRDALRFGFRADGWTFLYDGKENKELLYDRDKDPNEQQPLTDIPSDISKSFRDRLQERVETLEDTSKATDVPDIKFDEGVQERLEALGYQE